MWGDRATASKAVCMFRACVDRTRGWVRRNFNCWTWREDVIGDFCQWDFKNLEHLFCLINPAIGLVFYALFSWSETYVVHSVADLHLFLFSPSLADEGHSGPHFVVAVLEEQKSSASHVVVNRIHTLTLLNAAKRLTEWSTQFSSSTFPWNFHTKILPLWMSQKVWQSCSWQCCTARTLYVRCLSPGICKESPRVLSITNNVKPLQNLLWFRMVCVCVCACVYRQRASQACLTRTYWCWADVCVLVCFLTGPKGSHQQSLKHLDMHNNKCHFCTHFHQSCQGVTCRQ